MRVSKRVPNHFEVEGEIIATESLLAGTNCNREVYNVSHGSVWANTDLKIGIWTRT